MVTFSKGVNIKFHENLSRQNTHVLLAHRDTLAAAENTNDRTTRRVGSGPTLYWRHSARLQDIPTEAFVVFLRPLGKFRDNKAASIYSYSESLTLQSSNIRRYIV
jgi:hypothetical protein